MERIWDNGGINESVENNLRSTWRAQAVGLAGEIPIVAQGQDFRALMKRLSGIASFKNVVSLGYPGKGSNKSNKNIIYHLAHSACRTPGISSILANNCH